MSLAKCLKKLKIDSSHEDSIISGLASLTEQGNLEGYRKATLALDQAMNDTLDEQEDIHIQLEKQGYSFKEDNSAKDSKLLEEKLNKQGYTFTITPKSVRDFVAKDKTREAQATTATNLASKFGKRITWIDAKGDFGINGVVVPNIKDVIFLDVNTKYPAHAVMGHELSHHLEYDKPDVYKDLVASMEGLLKNHKEYADKYKIEGASHKDIVKEMIGDIMGDNFTKQDFWNKLADQDRSLFTKIADTIKAWLEQFIKSDNLGSDAFVKDVKKAREVIALAVAKYKDVQQPTQSAEAKFHKVWHGSPHDHNKFDSTKIGTGEGAQAYGYGHYFTDTKEVAEFYKGALQNSSITIDGKEIPNNSGGHRNVDVIEKLLQDSYGISERDASYMAMSLARKDSNSKEDAIKYLNNRIEAYRIDNMQEAKEQMTSIRDKFAELPIKIEAKGTGKLYEVELAPKQEDYLLWDKPLSEQSDKVKRLLQNELRKHITIRSTQNNFADVMYDGEELGSFEDHKVPNVVQNVANHIPFSGEDLYKGYTEKQGSDKKASDYLHSLGIRGIKYLDGSSRTKGEGAYNYVIFDDNDVSITAKFSRTPKSLDAVEKSWDSKGIASSMSERNGIITLNKIVVPKDSRNAGKGTAAMRELTNYADTTNQQIALTPSADFGGNKVKLQAFYKRFGFRKNNEFNVMESMIRDPESAKFSRAPKLYSKLEQALEAANDKVFSTGSQVKLWLQSNAGKLGIKKDEIYWSGIDNWLDSQGKVSKQQVVEFVRQKGVTVEDKTLRTAPENFRSRLRERTFYEQDKDGKWYVYGDKANDTDVYDTEVEAAAKVAEYNKGTSDGITKHNNDKLTLPGGTNYKELVVTIPTIEKYNESDDTHFGDTGQGKQIGWLRMDTRDGGLFIEELQSQRAQQGRSKGFVNKFSDAEMDRYKELSNRAVGNFANSEYREPLSLKERAELVSFRNRREGVPPAPFVSDANNKATNAYITLLMKKALIEAVSNDHASVSWTTGDQQADRYDLSKQISRVNYFLDNHTLMAFDSDSEIVLNKKNVPENEIQDYIGKDATHKLLESTPRKGTTGRLIKSLEGVELKAGGEWAQSMYGNEQGLNLQGKPSLMSQAANDIFKHVGSGKVESINGQPGFYVTPEMRSKDLPLFSRVISQDSEYLDAVNSGDMEKAQKLVNDKLAIIGAYWHGTPSGDLRGGMTGLHVGTKQAAMEALEARIGIPADGRGWDGTREYGKTLLAGRDRVASGQFGKYRDSGYNMDSPKDDFYAEDHELPTVGNDVKVDPSWKPWIRPVLIVGDMDKRKKTDSAANSLMYKLLSQGKATRGFYYENDGEDAGSVSAVLPNGDHVKIKLPDAVTYDDEGNVIPLSERFNKDNNDIRFSRAKPVTVDGIERPTTNSEGKQINNPVNFWKWFGDSKVVDKQGAKDIPQTININGRSLSQFADAIARRYKANKIDQSKGSRYYSLPDGRELRVSDHEFPRKHGGGVAQIDIVYNKEDDSVDIFHNEVKTGIVTKELSYRSLNLRGGNIGGLEGFNYDIEAWETAVTRAIDDVISYSSDIVKTISINGVDRPITNSEGKAIHPTQEGISNFWKWFGDSKVVDDQGRPLVVYHGTSQDISVFNTDGGKGKTYGTGSFFSSNPDISATYTGGSNNGNMIPVYLRMEKPAVLDAQDSNWNRLNKNTRVILPEVTVSAQVDEDLLAVLEERTPDQGATYRLKARNTTLGRLLPDDFRYIDDYGSTDDIARWARQKGYAGLIINNVVDQGATGNFANERSSTPSTIYVVYNPNQIKSAIGNNGEYSSANNDIRFSKEAIPEETTYQKSQRTVQDKFNRFSVIRDWLKERGVKLTELSNVYDAEERYHAKVANQLEDFREKVRNPLVEKIAKAGFTLSDVQDFLLAQHASEANKQIQKVRNDSEALAYGVTDEEASEYLSKAKPELAALANELRDVTEQAKQLRLDAGILNKDITDNWDNTYKHYIPVKGDESIQGTGKGLNVKHKDKRRLGHEKRNEAVIENILMDYERAVMEVEKNRVGKYLVMFAAEANNPDLITVGQPEKRNILKENNSYAIVDSNGVIHSVYVNKIDAQRNAPPGSSVQKMSDPRVIAQASPVLAPNEVNVYMDGHAIRVQLNDDLLARAYANMGVESVGAIVEAGRVLNSYLSKVYTGYNPEFIVTNIIRDFTSGIVNLTGEEGTLMAVKAIGNYPKMFADLFRYAITRKSTELIDSYRANGGNTGAAYLSDMERLGKEISSEYASYQGVIANIKAGDGANAFRAAGRKVFNSTLKWIEHLNQAGENAMRLAAYKAMLDSGKTVEQSSKVAKNITVNFNRRGEIGQTANALYLFFNASVQGSAAVLHANLRGNHKYQANALTVGMVSLGYMLAAGLGGMDEEEYDKIDDTTKERNLIIGSGDSYVKIPIPYGYGFFFNTGRVIADAQRKGEFGKAPFRMAVNAVEELTPFGNLVNSDEINSEQVVGGVAPTALQIPYQMSTNTSLFTGKEIRPVSPFDSSQPEREQMFRNTKGTVYDDMAGLLSNAGFDVSPENIKFLTRTLTGGAGALVDTAVSSSKLKAQGVELDIKEMPFIRKFAGENTISNDRSAYYKAVEEATKAAEEFSRARKNNDISSMKKIMEDKRELLAMDKYANKLRKVIKLSRDMQDSVRLNEEIPIAEKRLKLKELEAQESKLYDKYLDVYKARVK